MAEKWRVKLSYAKKSLKFIIVIAVIAAVIIVARYIFNKLAGKNEGTTKHVQIETVQKAMFVERISERGDLEALEEVEIKSDVAGVIKELYVEDGDSVKEGQELFRIDDEYIKQQLKASQAEYDVASGQVDQARISRDLEIKRIDSSIEMARKSLELAKANLNSVTATGEQTILGVENELNKLKTETTDRYNMEFDKAELLLTKAELDLKTKKAALDMAKSETERYRKLFEQKFVSKSQYETAQKQLTEAQAIYESAGGEVKAAQLSLESAKKNIQQLKEEIANQEESLRIWRQSVEAQKAEAKLRVEQQEKEIQNQLDSADEQKKNAELRVLGAEKYMERSEAELNRIQEELKWTIKLAPRNGTITDCEIEAGQAVASGRSEWGGGQPIMKISDLSQMVVRAYVNEIEIRKVQEGQRAEIRVSAYQDRVFDGKVWKIAPTAKLKDNIRSFEVTVLITNASKELRPQMTADVDIIVSELDNVLQMPISALIEKDVTLVYTRIPQKEIDKFKVGQKLNVKLPNNEKLFPSEVTKIPQDTRYIDDVVIYEVCIRVENNPDEFRWGPPVPMDIFLSDTQKLSEIVCIVHKEREPYALLITGDEQSSTDDTSQTEKKEVRLVVGRRNENNIEIIEGLQESDRVKVPELSRKDLFMWED
jgi:multidrug efflux pump subunit AcrA (membrane-fusion protein)